MISSTSYQISNGLISQSKTLPGIIFSAISIILRVLATLVHISKTEIFTLKTAMMMMKTMESNLTLSASY